jgi:hypothetical protein
MFRVQYLADARRDYRPTARHANRGRVWIDLCKPVRRLAVAEQIQRRAMIDLDAHVRVHPVERV